MDTNAHDALMTDIRNLRKQLSELEIRARKLKDEELYVVEMKLEVEFNDKKKAIDFYEYYYQKYNKISVGGSYEGKILVIYAPVKKI